MKTIITYIGAGVAGLLASACCWIPALLGAGAASSLGISATLAPYRPFFLGLTAVFLAVGFYFAYRRPKAACAGSCCEPSRSAAKRRAGIAVMWMVAVVAVASAAYPFLIAQSHSAPATAAMAPGAERITLAVQGIDCPACAIPIEEQLRKVPGVLDAKLDYERAIVEVFVTDPKPPAEQLVETVTKTGFPATLVNNTQGGKQ